MRTPAGLQVKGRKLLSSRWVFAGLGALGLIAILMAWDIIPGAAPNPLKVVSVTYPAGADKAQLTIFIEPLLGVLNRDKPVPPLLVQWTNHTATDLSLPQLLAQPSDCFELKHPAPAATNLPKGATRVVSYDLNLKDCYSDQVALSLVGVSNGSGVPADFLVTTSPILITTSWRLHLERLIRILSSLAAPIVLALVALLTDRYQKRREEAQKEAETAQASAQKEIDNDRLDAQKLADDTRLAAQQDLERRLEVWKLVFPLIDGYSRKHYILISRQMDLIVEVIAQKPLDKRRLMLEIVILRSAFNRLGDEVGGFSLQNSSAEEICSILTNHLLHRVKMIGDNLLCYVRSARAVHPVDLFIEADEKLRVLAQKDSDLAKFHEGFADRLSDQDVLQELSKLLSVTIRFLDFENNLLWYPWWYRSAPTFDFTQKFADLGLSREQMQRLDGLLEILKGEVPKECWA